MLFKGTSESNNNNKQKEKSWAEITGTFKKRGKKRTSLSPVPLVSDANQKTRKKKTFQLVVKRMAKRKTGDKSRLVKNYSERDPAWNSLLLLTQSHATNHYLLCFSLRFFFAIPSVKVSVTSAFLFPSTYTFCFGLSVWKLKPDIQYKWMEKKEKKKRNRNKKKNAVQPMESTTTGKEGEKERERPLYFFF